MSRETKSIRVLTWEDLPAKGITYCRKWIRRMMKEKTFPQSFKLGNGCYARNHWYEHEVDQWIANRAKERYGDGQKAA